MKIRITDYERLQVEREVGRYFEATLRSRSCRGSTGGNGKMSDAEDLLNAIGEIYRRASQRTQMEHYARLEQKEQV